MDWRTRDALREAAEKEALEKRIAELERQVQDLIKRINCPSCIGHCIESLHSHTCGRKD